MLYYVTMENIDIKEIFTQLQRLYPEAKCELEFADTFQLLVAVILSAQCTDKRVNLVTQELFKTYKTPYDFLRLTVESLGKLIYSCGFYNNKAKNILLCCEELVGKYGGSVPDTFEKLIALNGVGRKTANVVLSVGFNKPSIAVDTHVFRVSHRLGLSDGKTPYDVEKHLNERVPAAFYAVAHHLLIFHGRYTCKSQRPLCGNCPLIKHCLYFNETAGLKISNHKESF